MQIENPLSSTRVEAFPIGLRVLVVDDDLTWLKILEKMLRKCYYEVTTCCKARAALDLLREKKDKFDIVISDVNMPDMDGFKLLEHVGLEMDLPVIMMSVDGETSRVMKGVQHGACDYLLKPIRMKELKNIWQHVYRKRILEVKDIEGYDINDDIHILRSGSENFDDRLFIAGYEMSSLRKRKDVDTRECSDQELSDTATVKKARVIWSVDLHQKFVNAVDQIGFDKVGPKKILDLMNVSGLTRENVASHLQKYRMYLSRLQKQNEGRNFTSNLHADYSLKSHSGTLDHQKPTTFHQNTRVNTYNVQNFRGQIMMPDVQETEPNREASLPQADKNEGVTAGIYSEKAKNASQVGEGALQPLKVIFPNINHKQIHPSISKQQALRVSTPSMQFVQYQRHDHEPFDVLEEYSCPAQTQEPQVTLWHLQCPPSIVSISRNSEKDETDFDVKPSADHKGHRMKILSAAAYKGESVSVQVEQGVLNFKELGATCENNKAISSKEHCYEQTFSLDLAAPPLDLDIKYETDLVALPEDSNLYSLQGIGCLENVGFNGMEIHQHNGFTSLTELQSNWYEEMEFNCEYLYDPLDYPLLDERLFA